MNDLGVLLFPLLVAGVALLVFVIDLVLPLDPTHTEGTRGTERRGVGAATVAGLLGVLALTWLVPVSGLAFGASYVADPFTLYVQRLLLAGGALAALGSIDHADTRFPRRQGEYYVLMLSSLLGMMMIAGARDLILLVVSFELMGIPLYALAAMHKKQQESIEGAIKLYLTGAVSTVVTLYGVSLMVGVADSTLLSEVAQVPVQPVLALGMVVALAGMSFKLGAVPFHMWVPDTYQGAPTPFVAFLSVAPKTAGFAAFVRLFIEGFGELRNTWWPILLAVAVLTMVIGNLFAIPQTNVKRMLGYSGIAHIGLMLVGFGIGTIQGLAALLFYLTAYMFTNMGAFFVVSVVDRSGSAELDAWRGLSRRSPALALAMLLFLLSLAGIPFVAGFWAKFMLFWAMWEAGMGGIVLLGATLAVLALFYYLKVASSIYIDAPPEGATPRIPRVGLPTAAAISIALAGVVGMGALPRPFFESALAAARSIFGG